MNNSRNAWLWGLLVAVSSAGAPPRIARAQEPTTRFLATDQNFFAHRVDSDVYGWNKRFTEMACIASDVRRDRDSEITGQRFLLVFAVGSVTPLRNVHLATISSPPSPHEPVELKDVRETRTLLDFSYQRQYSRRPKHQPPPGAMTIEPIWEFVELGDGLCQPAVGMVLRWKGQTRYQPHKRMRMEGDCDRLRYTDHRTYWAKSDLGAVMIRFDYGKPNNEESVRLPLTAFWKRAQPVTIVLRAPRNANGRKAVKKVLAHYGHVKEERTKNGNKWLVSYGPDFLHLGYRVAGQLKGQVSSDPPPKGIDLLVVYGRGTPVPVGTDAGGAADFDPVHHDCGGLLPDCDK